MVLRDKPTLDLNKSIVDWVAIIRLPHPLFISLYILDYGLMRKIFVLEPDLIATKERTKPRQNGKRVEQKRDQGNEERNFYTKKNGNVIVRFFVAIKSCRTRPLSVTSVPSCLTISGSGFFFCDLRELLWL